MEKYVEIEKDGETVLVKSKEWAEYQSNAREEVTVSTSGLPIHVKGLTLDNYIGTNRSIPRKLKKYVEEFSEKYCHVHLYFWSHENGTQKTTTASIVGNLLSKAGKTVRFVLMGDLLKLLTDSSFEEEKKQKVAEYKTCDFLIVDDSFDKKKATIYQSGYQISFLDQFLRDRLECTRRATCFTSNFSIDEIDENVFGISLKKLVKRSIIDPFEFTTSYEERNRFNPDDLWG